MTDYRYTLYRDLRDPLTAAGRHDRLCWVMLNPSTADEIVDDPTIRRVIRFTRDAGYGALEVVNLFAARATNPKRLYEHLDPVGPENMAAICDAFLAADGLVFAWGASGGARALSQGASVGAWARRFDLSPLCLGVTADGSPRHPLYVRADQPLVPYEEVS